MDTTVGFPCLGTFGGYIDPNVALGGFDGERGEGRGGEGKGGREGKKTGGGGGGVNGRLLYVVISARNNYLKFA